MRVAAIKNGRRVVDGALYRLYSVERNHDGSVSIMGHADGSNGISIQLSKLELEQIGATKPGTQRLPQRKGS